MNSLADRLSGWNAVPIITEDELAVGPDRLETRAKVKVGGRPMIESSGAIFHGVTAGYSLRVPLIGHLDIGVVRGRDVDERKIMTFYTRGRVRVWAETYDSDAFMDSAAYVDLAVRHNLVVTLGGRLSHPPEGVPELKMEYLVIEGPNGGSEERLLYAEPMPERAARTWQRLGLYLRRKL